MKTATACAFRMTELLEATLVNVDTQILLVSAQRVNKGWRDNVLGSKDFQRALFLKSSTVEAITATNPDFGRFDKYQTPNTTFINPLARAGFTLLTSTSRADQSAMSYPNASYRNMLVCQPPAQEANVLCTHKKKSKRIWMAVVRAADSWHGVTIGDVVDRILDGD